MIGISTRSIIGNAPAAEALQQRLAFDVIGAFGSAS